MARQRNLVRTKSSAQKQKDAKHNQSGSYQIKAALLTPSDRPAPKQKYKTRNGVQMRFIGWICDRPLYKKGNKVWLFHRDEVAI